MYSEEEANRKFCEFIKRYYNTIPKPITPDRLSLLHRKRVVTLVHNSKQAEKLGYELDGWEFANEHRIMAPYYDYMENEAFDEFDQCSLFDDDDINYLSRLLDDGEDDEECLLADMNDYLEFFYVVNEIVNPVGINELI